MLISESQGEHSNWREIIQHLNSTWLVHTTGKAVNRRKLPSFPVSLSHYFVNDQQSAVCCQLSSLSTFSTKLPWKWEKLHTVAVQMYPSFYGQSSSSRVLHMAWSPTHCFWFKSLELGTQTNAAQNKSCCCTHSLASPVPATHFKISKYTYRSYSF